MTVTKEVNKQIKNLLKTSTPKNSDNVYRVISISICGDKIIDHRTKEFPANDGAYNKACKYAKSEAKKTSFTKNILHFVVVPWGYALVEA